MSHRNPVTSSSKTNILLVIIDTHRADRLGVYGCKRNLTPNMDAFARQSAVFQQAIAPAQWTIPAHASFFTGLPPSTHLVTQANSVLDARFPTVAEILTGADYETVGFCNNPLVGLIHNNLRRGFASFYNYCGTAPDTPSFYKNGSTPFYKQLERSFIDTFRQFVDPIQNLFATSNKFLTTATHPIFVPLWTKFVHYKGDTSRSIRDASSYLRGRLQPSSGEKNPFFLFLNLMETHLPYLPPAEYIRRYAPIIAEDKRAADFMRSFNVQAMRWLIPLKRPFTEIEQEALGQMYDAEVAYQDHLLGELLELLDRPQLRDNTLVMIGADHGEMLGEHQFMGHGFGVYHELIRVPMMVRTPGQESGTSIDHPVSTTRLFHTILETAGLNDMVVGDGLRADILPYSLLRVLNPDASFAPDDLRVVSEAYGPVDALKMMSIREPELIEPFHTRETHRAVYHQGQKLYSVEDVNNRLLTYDDRPPPDLNNVSGDLSAALEGQLNAFLEAARSGHPEGWSPATSDLSNPMIEQRLRDLGYMA